MAKDRFLIAPFEAGLQTDVRPWLLPDNAFSVLQNAYVFRGRTRKRPGAELQNTAVPVGVRQLYSRLAIRLGTTDIATGALPVTAIPGNLAKVGMTFSVGFGAAVSAQTITVTALGAPATFITNTTLAGIVINLTVGGVNNITWAASAGYLNQPVYFYPGEPVMGLYQMDTSAIADPLINDETTIGFDTQFGYRYITGHWELMGVMPAQFNVAQPAGAAVWTSADWQFIWATNWRGLNDNTRTVYATNNKPLSTVASGLLYDGIKAYGVVANTWQNLSPRIYAAATETVIAALCLQVFKGCLFMFNVMQRVTATNVDTRYSNMVRWCAPDANPLVAGAWDQDGNAGAGRLFLPTSEEIISVATVKDRLIVFCERSTYEIVYSGNPGQLFIAQRINSELGSESTFSPTLFDRAVLSVGNVGITACNGTSVERIDEKIPEGVFSISNVDNAQIRVHGVRDYYTEAVYWTFPSGLTPTSFPDRVLLYNYRNGTWGVLTDTVTAFGYDQNITGLTWAAATYPWSQANAQWQNPAVSARFLAVLAGNQQGVCFKYIQDKNDNADARAITAMDFSVPAQITITSMNHALDTSALGFIQINNCTGTNMGNLNGFIFEVSAIIDVNRFLIYVTHDPGTTYTGLGTIKHCSILQITTKEFNLYQKEGYKCVIRKIDFNLDQQTAPGARVSVQYATDTNGVGLQNWPVVFGTNTSISLNAYLLKPNEVGAVQIWRSFFPVANGYYIQFSIGYSYDDMFSPNIVFSDFQMHAIMIYANPASSRLQ